MWRINGVRYYQLLLIILIFIEVTVIVVVATLTLTSTLNLISTEFLRLILQSAVVITALMTINLIAYIVLFQLVSNRNDRIYNKQYHDWMKTWAKAFFTQTLPEKVALDRAVVNAHLDFTKSLPDAEQMLVWSRDLNLLNFWQKQLHGRNKIDVLLAIEAIGLLGDHLDLPDLFDFMTKPDLDTRITSTIAIAQILHRTPQTNRDALMIQFAHLLVDNRVPVFVLEDMYSILDKEGRVIKAQVLEIKSIHESLLLATINSIRVNFEADYADSLIDYLYYGSPIVQQAILKLFGTLQYIPPSAFREVLLATRDDDRGVREEALNTLKHVPLYRTRLPLWFALGDDDWWIRYNAAKRLLAYGDDGRQVLHTASQKHDSELGRAIAQQVVETNI